MSSVTDLFCEGFETPIPYPGRPDEFEDARGWARSASGSQGMKAMVMRWTVEGRSVVLDLNRTRVVAMVERAPASRDSRLTTEEGR